MIYCLFSILSSLVYLSFHWTLRKNESLVHRGIANHSEVSSAINGTKNIYVFLLCLASLKSRKESLFASAVGIRDQRSKWRLLVEKKKTAKIVV